MNKFLLAGIFSGAMVASSMAMAAPYQCTAKGGSTIVTSARLPSLSAAKSNALFKCRSHAKKPSTCHWTSCKNLRHAR